ncbi:hypothetical protein A2415_01615 [candidate division WWE3 bacterium RIFOXYC1_FULL_39_7]|uniref:DUF1189 domain-containing protein n=1 Tax=candidate division WWE3 bacterium RIFOXYC1_FULL_39_7 TaxID=1802643 RepID=A0A1F4WKS5_UNCKA|nr:MAG: hypothetical protein A2415_01615 [candidate division WWE3 bacterium RIFOXYC1_FULL_39_7]
MNRVKAFFYVYKKSLSSIGYYKEVVVNKFSFSLKYFLSLAILSALIVTVTVSIKTYPQITKTIDEMMSKVKEIYPQELVISTKGNEWSINVPEPLVIPFPDVDALENIPADATQPETQSIPENLIVLNHAGTVEDFENMKTLILVNEKNILIKEANNYSVYPIENLPEAQIDKAKFVGMVDGLKEFTKFLPYIISVLVFVGIVFYYLIFRLIYLFIAGFMTWLITFAFGSKLTYVQNLQVCLHALTLPITIEVIATTLGFNITIPFWFALTNMIFAIFAIYTMSKNTDTTALTPPTQAEELQETQ